MFLIKNRFETIGYFLLRIIFSITSLTTYEIGYNLLEYHDVMKVSKYCWKLQKRFQSFKIWHKKL